MRKRNSIVWKDKLIALLFMGIAASPLIKSNLSQASMWPNQAQQLEKQLRASSVSVRIKAVQSLGDISPSLARAGIVLALADADAQVRKRAAMVALMFAYQGLGSEVSDWLQSRDAEERSLAVRLLCADAKAEELTKIATLLSDTDKSVRFAVATSLARVSSSLTQQAASILIAGLDDPEPEVRVAVATSLGKVGDSSAALALAAHLQDLEVDVRIQLILALGVLENDAAVPSLLIALADQDDAVVAAAAQSLGQLGSEAAIPGLVAVLEASPLKEPGRRAAEALAKLGTDIASSELFNQLSRPDSRDFVVSLIERYQLAKSPALKGCLLSAVGHELLACVELNEALGEGPEMRLQLVDEGRLTPALALSQPTEFPARELVILALEQLAGPDLAGRTIALNFLAQAERLPQEAARPVRESLAKFSWSAVDIVRLLEVLAQCDNANIAAGLATFLESTYPAIRGAAARASVAQGLDGAELSKLLLHVRAEVVEGAVEQLRRTQTVAQAQVVIELLLEGRSGRRSLLQSTLLALPEGLSASQVESLYTLLAAADGKERDAIVSGLVRHGEIGRLKQLASQGSRADRLKIAQLGYFHPQGEQLAAGLLDDSDPRLTSLALLVLGARGEKGSLALVIEKVQQKPGRPRYVQAAALQSLRWFHERSVSVPAQVLTVSVCTSAHTVLQVRALELASSLKQECPGTEWEELLRRSEKPWVREAAARAMRDEPKFEQALKRCSNYETRPDIAEICRFPERKQAQRSQDYRLPYQEVELRTPFEQEPPSLLPATMLRSDEPVVYVSDRRGRVLVASGDGRGADLFWAY